MTQPTMPVTTAKPVEVGVIGVNLPSEGPATGIWEHAQPGRHILAYDIRRLTENLAIGFARTLFGDSIRIVTTAQLAGA